EDLVRSAEPRVLVLELVLLHRRRRRLGVAGALPARPASFLRADHGGAALRIDQEDAQVLPGRSEVGVSGAGGAHRQPHVPALAPPVGPAAHAGASGWAACSSDAWWARAAAGSICCSFSSARCCAAYTGATQILSWPSPATRRATSPVRSVSARVASSVSP